MNDTLRIALALGLLLGAAACKGNADDAADAGGADKAALEAAAKLLVQPVARISGYQPFLRGPDGKDAYAPKRRNDLLKVGAYVSGEIRFAATGARQKMEPSPATNEVSAALAEISKVCADATDPEAFAKCDESVKALDAALAKAATAASAAGVSTKIPRVAPESITDEAKKAMAPFLKASQPGPAEQAYVAKRSDPKASVSDVSNACQAAVDEAGMTAGGFEKAEEPLRLVAVTHKLTLDSWCNTLNATEPLRKDLNDCRKKPKTPDCKSVCAKVRQRIEDGLPAATFATLEQDANSICKE